MMTNQRKKPTGKNILSLGAGILIAILLVFFGIACIRTAYNLSKVITEEKEWIGLSDEGRRKKAYGELYVFSERIKKQTKTNATVLFITTDTRAHYLVKYFLYPRRITVVKPNAAASSPAFYAAVFLPNCKEFDRVIKKVAEDYERQVDIGAKNCEALYRKK